MQWSRETSFARQIARLLQARRATGLASGRLVQVVNGPAGCVATLSSLPGGGYWLLAANFSERKQHLACPLPAGAQGPARDVLSGQSLPTGRAVEIDLDARQARHILLGEPKTHARNCGRSSRKSNSSLSVTGGCFSYTLTLALELGAGCSAFFLAAGACAASAMLGATTTSGRASTSAAKTPQRDEILFIQYRTALNFESLSILW